MNEMHEQRTEGLVLDKEVSQVMYSGVLNCIDGMHLDS